MAQSRRADKAQQAAAAGAGPRILKKYPNRRLYDTEISSYITLSDVKAMVLKGIAFEVRDAKTGEDLTRSILLQIILEEETGGVPMFSTSTLAQIIRFYGHAMQGMMGSYLEQNLQTFTDVQARLAEQSKGLYDPKLQSPELWTQVPERAGADGAEPDGQLPRAIAQHLHADAGTAEQAGRNHLPGTDRARRADQAMSGGVRFAVGAWLAALSMARRRGDAGAHRVGSCACQRRAAPAASAAPAAASAPVEFIGLLEAGTTYVAEMAYDARALRTWRPVKEVRVAKNVAWTIDWTNIDRFPQLKTAATQAKPQRFRFTVVKNDVVSGSPVDAVDVDLSLRDPRRRAGRGRQGLRRRRRRSARRSAKMRGMTDAALEPPRTASAAPKIGFVSLGCPKALTDSELILTRLSAEGYATSKTFAGADLVIVNTCGFIDDAVRESLDTIGEALADNGKVDRHRLPRREGGRGRRQPRAPDAPERARGDRPARDRGSDGRGARPCAEAARSVPRPGAAPPRSASS